jgi:hypothetical protein
MQHRRALTASTRGGLHRVPQWHLIPTPFYERTWFEIVDVRKGWNRDEMGENLRVEYAEQILNAWEQ